MKRLAIIALATFSLMLSTTANAKRISCKSFKTQAEAQAYYNKRKKAGKSGWKSLDRDRDGIACENGKKGKQKGKKSKNKR